MAKEENKKSCDCAEKECKCGDKCECDKECKCGCGCGCCCGCKCKVLKLIALIIVFLAGIGCGCLICCCNGCKSHHRIPAPIAMAKHTMQQPRNNVIVIRTDGDEVVPEVAKMEGDFRNLKKHHRHHRPQMEAPVAPDVEAPAEPVVPEEPVVPAEPKVGE